MLPNVEPHMLYLFRKKRIETIPELWKICQRKVEPLASILRPEMDESLIDGVYEALHRLPMLNLDISLAIGDGEPVIIPKREFLTASKRFYTPLFSLFRLFISDLQLDCKSL